MSGTSKTASPYVNCHKRWGWVEIHWSDEKPDNWELGQYVCPVLSRYNIENPLPGVTGIPEEYRKKTLQEMHNAFTTDTSANVSADLHAKLLEKAKDFEKDNGFICSSVTQWVIVEIQPITGIEWTSVDALPSFEIWSFLQPREIGVRSQMKKEFGYVSDDKPRAGWFSTEIRWFREKDPYSADGTCTFVPRMSIKSNSINNAGVDQEQVIRWQDVPCTLTDGDSPSLKFHPKRPSYGKGLRFLFKIPITVKNVQTSEDRVRRVNAYTALKNNQNMTEEKKRQLLRFEVGSYLKVWARNSAFPWNKENPPADDFSSKCMDSMQELDQAILHPNGRFNKPTAYEIIVSEYEKYDYRAYIRKYYLTGPGMIQEFMKRVAQSAPADRVGQMAASAFVKPIVKIALNDTTYKPLPDEDNETFLKPSHLRCPEIFNDVESDTEKEKTRYKCGNEFFRPYSFRNHTWKRNRFSMDPKGAYDEKYWYYVLLWPEELIEGVENLTGYFYKDPTKGSWHHLLICSVLYVLIYKGMLDMAENAQFAAETTLDPQKKKNQENTFRMIRALMDCDDLATIAATISRLGWPDLNEGRWLDENNNKSLSNMITRFKAILEEGSLTDPAVYYSQIFQVIKSYFCTVADLGGKKRSGVKGTISEAKGVLDTWSKIAGVALPKDKKNDKPKVPPAKKEKEPFLKGPELKGVSFLDGELEIAMEEGNPRCKRLKAWPLPPPYLSWLAFVISLKSKGSLGCKISTKNILQNSAEMKLDISAKGEEGIFFDLAAFWTLLTQMDSTFKDVVKPASGNRKNAADFEFLDTLKKLLEFADAQIGLAIKITLNSKLPLNFDFSKILDGKNFLSLLTNKPFSLIMDLELPITMKLSCISKTLGTLKLPLVAASPSAIVVCPTGIELQGSGMFAGKKEKISSGKEWMRIKLGPGSITVGSHKCIGINTVKIGQPIQSEAHSLKIIPVEMMKTEGTDVPFFQISIVQNISDDGIELNSKGVYKRSKLESLNADSRINFESSIDLSQNKIKTDVKYAAFIKKLLQSNQTCSLKVAWAGYVTEMQLADKQVTILSPRVDLSFMDKKYSLSETVEVNINVSHFEYVDMPLYCKLYEYNKPGMFGTADVVNREIKRKDSLKGHFKCEPLLDQATGKFAGAYRLNLPLRELGEIPVKGEDNDDCWEIVLKISVDFEGGYPLYFASGCGLPGLESFSGKQIKLLKVKLPTY